MNQQRFQLVKSIFYEAAELAPEDRRAFLERACDGDEPLRSEVLSLFTAEDRAAAFLEEPALGLGLHDLAHASSSAGEAASLPQRIGRYRIIRLIGEGGMGCVYEAEQDTPHRRVALKVVRAAASSPRLLRRFRHEVELLGRLQHPNIARIYDAGTAEVIEGGAPQRPVPFFAMELIEGRPITRFAQERRMDTRARMALLATVCDAVHLGHQQGVIHRDIKPGNILVMGSGDAAATPKIIDFGVARATDADLALTTLTTGAGHIIGTLAYMSPEQVCGDARAVDTRCDIYALGVVGYELLGGRVPYNLAGKLMPEAARIIRDEEPSRLSSISRAFRGDIETIIGRAMEKDPARRYASAAGLGGDIRRFLNNEPIIARPPTLRYQLAKFARRHKEIVAGLALVFLVLIAGVVASTIGWAQAGQALRTAQQQETKAQREARRAQHVSDILTRTFAAAEPGAEGGGRDVRVADLLDRAAVDLRSELADEPEIEMEIQRTLGHTYRGLGLYEEGLQCCQRAFDVAGQALGPEHETTLALTADVARLMILAGRDRAAAEQVCRQALERARALLGRDHPSSRALLDAMGMSVASQGRYPEGIALREELVDILRKLPSTATHRRELSAALYALGWVQERVHATFAAVASLEESLEIERELAAGGPVDRKGSTRWLLGFLHLCHGRLDQYTAINLEVLQDRRLLLGDDHPLTVFSLFEAVRGLSGLGRHAEAIPLAEELVQQYGSGRNEEPASQAAALVAYGRCLHGAGRRRDAEAAYGEAIAMHRTIWGDAHAETLDGCRRIIRELSLPPEPAWTSATLRAMSHLVGASVVGGFVPVTFALDELRWSDATFELARWDPALIREGEDPRVMVVASGSLTDLSRSAEPEPGIYCLALTVPVEGRAPVIVTRWLPVQSWNVGSFVFLDQDEGQGAWDRHAAKRPQANRRAGFLAWNTAPNELSQGPQGEPAFFGVIADATVTAPPGTYLLEMWIDDGARLWINDDQVVDSWSWKPTERVEATVPLRGQDAFHVEYFQGRGVSVFELTLKPLDPAAMRLEAALAR